MYIVYIRQHDPPFNCYTFSPGDPKSGRRSKAWIQCLQLLEEWMGVDGSMNFSRPLLFFFVNGIGGSFFKWGLFLGVSGG